MHGGVGVCGIQEKVKGRIEVAQVADLATLSEDIFSIAPERIRAVKVVTTVMDGRAVFQR